MSIFQAEYDKINLEIIQAEDNPVEDAIDDDDVLGDPVAVQDENDVSINVSNLDDLLNSSDDELF